MEGTKLDKGTYELMEETLQNTIEELAETKTRLRKSETEKYNLSLDIMQLKLEIDLNATRPKQKKE